MRTGLRRRCHLVGNQRADEHPRGGLCIPAPAERPRRQVHRHPEIGRLRRLLRTALHYQGLQKPHQFAEVLRPVVRRGNRDAAPVWPDWRLLQGRKGQGRDVCHPDRR